MPTINYVILSLIIHFGIPSISEDKKSIKNNSTQNKNIDKENFINILKDSFYQMKW